jgi:hypothetical protein
MRVEIFLQLPIGMRIACELIFLPHRTTLPRQYEITHRQVFPTIKTYTMSEQEHQVGLCSKTRNIFSIFTEKYYCIFWESSGCPDLTIKMNTKHWILNSPSCP